MRLGFASIYAFRPHVEHNAYLAHLAREAGHEVAWLTCDAQLPACYARALKGTGRTTECPRCIAGGARSYAGNGVSSLRGAGPVLDEARAMEFAFSSTCTILRTEPREQWETPEFRALQGEFAQAASRAYGAARAWIEREQLDAVICFNGRFEANRAVVEAAADAGLPYLTVERTWFGDGLQFAVNANCLDLKQLDRMNAAYRERPLTEPQARRIARHLAARFLRRNDKEWRAYNQQARSADWPAAAKTGSGPRVLIVPSSRNEVDGHSDWAMQWPQLTDGLELVLQRLGAANGAAVLRAHPNWSESIGRRTGELSERYYQSWARRRGVHFIRSSDPDSTFDLIEQADVVVVTGGSAAFEASALGKPVVALAPSAYQTAGICVPVYGPDDMAALDQLFMPAPNDRIRRALRYGYTHVYRFGQFVDHVRAITTTRYRYLAGADFGRIERMLSTGMVEPDDPEVAAGADGEDAVVSCVAARQWDRLMHVMAPQPQRAEVRVARRAALRWLDGVREWMPKGDR